MKKAEVAALICDLPIKDRKIYGAIVSAAEAGRPAPTCDDLVEVSGYSAVSSTVGAVQRLEQRGLIEVRRYQRSRQIMIVESGLWTARPLNEAPHWRERPREIPTPSPVAVKSRDADVSADILKWASSRGVSLSEALADLVYVGWKVEMERG
ncbi:hypothetical protein [Sphingopyxis macrogoltabida]|uniref:Uncharacterized protein n=1 Tax=Sphingopyxis macrogoltabida TaxID=33050 RepID=A0A0N9UBV9_SPHMC|nr:hypothetical protein [Sphingopyxis macrogoltabida]ALH82919.1 hypothetical protein AN936_21940 [Sphingopyxis macrogoltabida]